MAAIKILVDVNGKNLYYTLITTDRPNHDGIFGTKLFDDNFKSVNVTLSPKRSDCLKQIGKQITSSSIGRIVDLKGYNMPLDLEELVSKTQI